MTQVIDDLTLTFVGTPIQGEKGDTGKSAYQSYLETTTDNPVLSEADWVNKSTAGAAGKDGENGKDGKDGKDGADGANGADGKSSYQSYLDTTTDNPKKTEGEWVLSLKGEDGASAYQSYLDTTSDNPKKTETEWLASIKGDKGDKGDDGANGKDGVNGIDGKDGRDGTDGTGLNNRSYWASGTTYNPNDFVFAIGTSGGNTLFIFRGTDAYVSTTEPLQDSDHWIEFQAPAGANGKDGVDGVNGTDGKDGNNGADGKDGINGVDGTNGKDGVGIATTDVSYQAAISGTATPTGTWLASPPTVTSGYYLWTRVILTMTDNTVTTFYSIGYKGTNGTVGRGIQSALITYQESTSGTVVPTGTWSTNIVTAAQGNYLWTRTVYTYTNATTTTTYSVAYQGKDGSSGGSSGSGNAITSSNVTYQTSTSGTEIPSGSWLDTVPAVTKGEYLWTRTNLVFTDGTTSHAYGVSYQAKDGTDGTNGTNGIDGKDGEAGKAGSVWLNGITAPVSTDGVVNDFYINTDTGEVFKKTDDVTWTAQFTLPVTVKAAVWLLVTADPDSTVGENGAWALNSTNGTIWNRGGATWNKVLSIPDFADQATAQAAASYTTIMSPARTREFMEQYGITASYMSTATDLNNSLKGEFFNYSTSTAHYPGTSGYGRGITLPSSPDYTTQIAIENDSGLAFIRYQTAGTWSVWTPLGGGSTVEFATTDEAVAANNTTKVMSPTRTREYLASLGLGDTYVSTTANLNTITGSADRTVTFNYSATTSNIPVAGSYGRGIMFAGGGNYTTQVAWVNGTNDQYVRFNNGGTWTSWMKQGFNENDVVGTAWTDIPTINGWSNFAAQGARSVFRKLFGRVYIEMNLTGGTNGSQCAVLPEGYRPRYNTFFVAVSANFLAAGMYVGPDGGIRFVNSETTAANITAIFSFDVQ